MTITQVEPKLTTPPKRVDDKHFVETLGHDASRGDRGYGNVTKDKLSKIIGLLRNHETAVHTWIGQFQSELDKRNEAINKLQSKLFDQDKEITELKNAMREVRFHKTVDGLDLDMKSRRTLLNYNKQPEPKSDEGGSE